MKPIWYFVGILLLVVGGIIGITGIVQYFSPPEHQPVLSHLHTNMWWGGVMVLGGAVFLLANRKKTVT
jgi:predicted membrane channel-forming protein YqfA (hemolysin III family)